MEDISYIGGNWVTFNGLAFLFFVSSHLPAKRGGLYKNVSLRESTKLFTIIDGLIRKCCKANIQKIEFNAISSTPLWCHPNFDLPRWKLSHQHLRHQGKLKKWVNFASFRKNLRCSGFSIKSKTICAVHLNHHVNLPT